MKTKLNIILSAIFILIFLISFSSAWIVPGSHNEIAIKSLSEIGDGTQISRIISENFGDFSSCMSVTDYSVFLYFTEGFNSIGKTYLASHSGVTVSERAISMANKNDPEELACAYGIASMSLMDSPSHNGFVVNLIQRTGLTNSLVHAIGEQCVDNKISNKQINADGRKMLADNYQQHRDFLIKVFSSDSATSSIDVPKMMDSFVAEVVQNDQYSVGFRGFTAIPTSIHIFFLFIFLLFLFLLAKLIKKQKKGLGSKIAMGILLFFLILIIVIYILYFNGTLWKAFQTISKPVCWVMPISGYETYVNQAVQNMVNFYHNGVSVLYTIPDPAGYKALGDASAKNTWKIYLTSFVIALGFVVYYLVKRRMKKRR